MRFGCGLSQSFSGLRLFSAASQHIWEAERWAVDTKSWGRGGRKTTRLLRHHPHPGAGRVPQTYPPEAVTAMECLPGVCTRWIHCGHEDSLYSMDSLRPGDPGDSGVPLPRCAYPEYCRYLTSALA